MNGENRMQGGWEGHVADEREHVDRLDSNVVICPSCLGEDDGDDDDDDNYYYYDDDGEGGEEGNAIKGANGLQDLVPTSLEDLTFNEEVHTVHLVEGDFFPEDSPAHVELRVADERDDAASALSGSARRRAPLAEKNSAEGDVHSSWLIEPRGAVKRVRWADEGATAAPLVQHARTFFMRHIDQTKTQQQQQQQQHQPGEPDKALQTFSPPPVLREETNTDGTTYLSCKAQRPAWRFAMRKRALMMAEGGSSDPPFRLQPPGNSLLTPAVTLLANLHPPYRRKHVGSTVLMRIATIAQNAKNGEALCDGGLQMPMVRASELRNVPLYIPF